MKITIVLGPFQPLPPAGIGAVEKVWHQLAGSFARAGHEVVLVGRTNTPEAAAPAPGVRVVAMRGFDARSSLWINLALDFAYALQVRSQVEKSDIVVTNSFWTPVILALGRRPPGTLIVHVARFPKGQMGLYRKAAFLQPVSSVVAAEIIRQSPRMHDKVRILPNPVDTDLYSPPAVPRRYDTDLTIVYAGRIHPEKGIDLLIRAFRGVHAALPRTRLEIVGPWATRQGGGGDAWLRSLQELARGLPVAFRGAIADPALLSAELRAAHVFTYPSFADKGEAFPLAVLEAMATGLPVAVSDLDCFRDYVANGEHGVVFDHRAENADALFASALIGMLSQPQTAARLGQNAARRARDFSLERVAQRYLGLFEEARALPSEAR